MPTTTPASTATSNPSPAANDLKAVVSAQIYLAEHTRADKERTKIDIRALADDGKPVEGTAAKELPPIHFVAGNSTTVAGKKYQVRLLCGFYCVGSESEIEKLKTVPSVITRSKSFYALLKNTKQLFHIDEQGQKQLINIKNWDKFEKDLNDILKTDIEKSLNSKQIQKLIVENSDNHQHKHTELDMGTYILRQCTQETLPIISDNNGVIRQLPTNDNLKIEVQPIRAFPLATQADQKSRTKGKFEILLQTDPQETYYARFDFNNTEQPGVFEPEAATSQNLVVPRATAIQMSGRIFEARQLPDRFMQALKDAKDPELNRRAIELESTNGLEIVVPFHMQNLNFTQSVTFELNSLLNETDFTDVTSVQLAHAKAEAIIKAAREQAATILQSRQADAKLSPDELTKQQREIELILNSWQRQVESLGSDNQYDSISRAENNALIRQKELYSNVIVQIRELLICPICCDVATLPKVLGTCGHIACHNCLRQLDDVAFATLTQSAAASAFPARQSLLARRCPLCRVELSQQPLPILALKGIASLLIENELIEVSELTVQKCAVYRSTNTADTEVFAMGVQSATPTGDVFASPADNKTNAVAIDQRSQLLSHTKEVARGTVVVKNKLLTMGTPYGILFDTAGTIDVNKTQNVSTEHMTDAVAKARVGVSQLQTELEKFKFDAKANQKQNQPVIVLTQTKQQLDDFIDKTLKEHAITIVKDKNHPSYSQAFILVELCKLPNAKLLIHKLKQSFINFTHLTAEESFKRLTTHLWLLRQMADFCIEQQNKKVASTNGKEKIEARSKRAVLQTARDTLDTITDLDEKGVAADKQIQYVTTEPERNIHFQALLIKMKAFVNNIAVDPDKSHKYSPQQIQAANILFNFVDNYSGKTHQKEYELLLQQLHLLFYNHEEILSIENAFNYFVTAGEVLFAQMAWLHAENHRVNPGKSQLKYDIPPEQKKAMELVHKQVVELAQKTVADVIEKIPQEEWVRGVYLSFEAAVSRVFFETFATTLHGKAGGINVLVNTSQRMLATQLLTPHIELVTLRAHVALANIHTATKLMMRDNKQNYDEKSPVQVDEKIITIFTNQQPSATSPADTQRAYLQSICSLYLTSREMKRLVDQNAVVAPHATLFTDQKKQNQNLAKFIAEDPNVIAATKLVNSTMKTEQDDAVRLLSYAQQCAEDCYIATLIAAQPKNEQDVALCAAAKAYAKAAMPVEKQIINDVLADPTYMMGRQHRLVKVMNDGRLDITLAPKPQTPEFKPELFVALLDQLSFYRRVGLKNVVAQAGHHFKLK